MIQIIQLIIVMCQINGSGSYAAHVDKVQTQCQKYFHQCVFEKSMTPVHTDDLSDLSIVTMDKRKKQYYFNRVVECTTKRNFR